MINDTERREVARRLRGLHLNPWDDAACEIAQCAGIACCNSECHGSNEAPECTMALCAHLADLIEPGEPKVKCVAEVKVDGEQLEKPVHDAAVELTGIDRDALLALADEMERMPQCELCPAEIVDCSAHPDGCPDALLDHYARRIREALGVVE